MSPSRRGISSLTLAVGLGVAVTTSQGIAQAETGDPPAPKNDTSVSSTENPTTQSPGTTVDAKADGASEKQPTAPTVRRKFLPLFDTTRITTRHHDSATAPDPDPDVPVRHLRTSDAAP